MKQQKFRTRKQLTKAESKYRTKVIQEYHFNKQEQRIFDNAKVKMGLSYKTIYTDMQNGKDFTFALEIKGRRISASSAKAGNTFKEAATAFSVINSAIKNMYGFRI
jgi:hypothetical protein